MSNIAHVVDGEASESDSEIEVAKSPGSELDSDKVFVVPGEAPESDDGSSSDEAASPTGTAKRKNESGAPGTAKSKIASQESSELDMPLNLAMSPPQSPSRIYTSLLHQKLWECNVSLRATLEGLLKHTTDISVEKLTSADKTLLSVQESMRATNANLSVASARLHQMNAALQRANCSNCLLGVKTNAK